MAEVNEALIVGLYDREVLKFGDFLWKLKSGRQSPLYYNQRILTSYNPENDLDIDQQMKIRNMAVEAYSGAIDRLGKPYAHIYGIPQAMTAMGGHGGNA